MDGLFLLYLILMKDLLTIGGLGAKRGSIGAQKVKADFKDLEEQAKENERLNAANKNYRPKVQQKQEYVFLVIGLFYL